MLRAISIVLLLAVGGAAAAQQRPATAMPAGRSDALQTIDDASAQLAELNKIHARTVEINAQLSKLFEALSKKVADVGKLAESASPSKSPIGAAAAGGSSQNQLLQATKQMQETQMSFNLQYLQLQSQMRKEDQQFETVSNVLKSKHDAAMAAINNIR